MNERVERRRLKRRAKNYIQVELVYFSNGPRSTWDLWFTIDIKPTFEGVLTEAEVERYLDQQAKRKCGCITKLGTGMYARK